MPLLKTLRHRLKILLYLSFMFFKLHMTSDGPVIIE